MDAWLHGCMRVKEKGIRIQDCMDAWLHGCMRSKEVGIREIWICE
jgi:hypothetical protein